MHLSPLITYYKAKGMIDSIAAIISNLDLSIAVWRVRPWRHNVCRLRSLCEESIAVDLLLAS